MFVLKDVCFSADGNQILKQITLSINHGEIFVIMGLSGAGKSTILRLLNGLIRPDSGLILVDGTDISKATEKELGPIRRKVGMVFQSSALFDSLTVAENVGFAWRNDRISKSELAQKVKEALALVRLADVESKMPAELSGGMKKRVGLARAIAMQPQAILYDEPTSGLDPMTSNTILSLIRDLNERLQVTSVVVTHDLEGAFKIADRVALLHEGEIIFVGTAAEMEQAQIPLVKSFLTGGQGEQGGY
ncbi:MAG: ATP-binding cassette domain-containing protein [Firmicutes bacterium]|jgi:phospholipid/cholesterol/gamma-HCH transport system ATP-binding protein|nr:ATP-binding cassette domain-containing protein [Bacillota bacterium]NLL89087.1 ATP-binding cassette domain-containing protein [Bacillota bacterium]HKM16836.1 ATP-binding cassette domain-containing protein [Limnochordia bacterium]